MKSSLSKITRVFRGQAYVEYALILALASIGLLWAVNQATDNISERGDEVACDIAYNGRVDCAADGAGGGGNDGLPIARFVFSCTGMACSFDGTGSFDSNGEIVRLDWEFAANGPTGDGWTPSHTYDGPDVYKVTLTVYDDDGNSDKTTKTVDLAEERGNECPPTVDVDGYAAGTILTDQFNGISITTHNPDRHPAMLFDSENPTGGDSDLGSPNGDFGGPGHGAGGKRGTPGENSQPQGMVIIISEDGDQDDPDDNASGGDLIFEFEFDASVNTMSFLDVDDAPKNPTVKLYDRDGAEFWSEAVPALGDNSFVLLDVNQTGVAKIVVSFPGSGSVDGIFFCEDEYSNSSEQEEQDEQVVEDNDISENQPPAAAFTYTCSDLFCEFDSSNSSDPDGTIDSVLWSFGDGMAGNAASVTHTYENGGTYEVTLTVTDNDGAQQAYTENITLEAPVEPEPEGDVIQCEGNPTVTSFTLMDAKANVEIGPLTTGYVIDRSDLAAQDIPRFNVVANTSGGTPAAVIFYLNGEKIKTEKGAPYAVGGDNRGNFNRWNVANGTHTLRATVNSRDNGRGEDLGCLEITITVQD